MARSLLLLMSIPRRSAVGATKETVIESPQRALILECVQKTPGIPVGELMRKLSVGSGTLYHHLTILERSGAIRTVSAGRRRLVYLASSATENPQLDAQQRALLRGRTARRIASFIVERPHRSISELWDDLGETPRVVYYHVKLLVDVGLVTSSSRTRHRDLSPTPALLRTLADLESLPEQR